jgi:hypothetical protein
MLPENGAASEGVAQSSGRINRTKSLRWLQRATHRAQIRAFLGFREMPPNYVTRRGRDAPPHSPAGWRRGAGHSPKYLVVDRRDGVSKALHCKSAYGRTILSIALIRDPYQTSTHQARCQARGAIALPPEGGSVGFGSIFSRRRRAAFRNGTRSRLPTGGTLACGAWAMTSRLLSAPNEPLAASTEGQHPVDGSSKLASKVKFQQGTKSDTEITPQGDF